MKWRWPVFLLLLASASVLSSLDSSLCLVMEQMPRSPALDFYRDLTELGKAYLYIYGSLAAWLGLAVVARAASAIEIREKARSWSEYAGFCLLTFAVTGLLVDVLKALVGRARPNPAFACSAEVLTPFTFDHVFQSFPSGHTQTVFTFALLVAARKPEWKTSAFLFAFLIAGTRLARNVHFFSDVLGGILIALIGLWVTERLCEVRIFPIRRFLPS